MSLATACPESPPARGALDTRVLVGMIWLATVVAYLAASFGQGGDLSTDDAMRLVQVRDLLAGQNWFDLTQHRLSPPAGVTMHWSRLIDLPLAALICARQDRAAGGARRARRHDRLAGRPAAAVFCRHRQARPRARGRQRGAARADLRGADGAGAAALPPGRDRSSQRATRAAGVVAGVRDLAATARWRARRARVGASRSRSASRWRRRSPRWPARLRCAGSCAAKPRSRPPSHSASRSPPR